jgi:hypothetical protein
MRVLLSPGMMRHPNFSDVLETACRSAGIDPDSGASAKTSSFMQDAASRLQQLADRILEVAGQTGLAANSFDSYFEHQSESLAQQPKKPCDPESVADELRITARMTSSDLNRLRREFALANHPDRADQTQREGATRRMMIANMLIDRELRRRHSASSSEH